MAKNKWQELQEEFLREHLSTGITAQDWCKKKGLNYQSARRYIKPSAAQSAQGQQRNSAHDAQSNKRAQSGKGQRGKEEEDLTNSSNDDEIDTNSTEERKGRDSRGRFTEGYEGNPNPVCSFKPGNQAARKHGAYSKYLNADDLFEAAEGASLDDELIFSRARALSVTKTIPHIMEDLKNADSIELRVDLYDKLIKAEALLDRLVARVESLEGSISKLRIDSIAGPRLVADTSRIKAATAKLIAETEKLTSENKDVTAPMSSVVDDIQAMPNGGNLSV